MNLMDSLCYRCFCCWGSTKDHKAKCDAYPSGEYHDGLPVHKITLVDTGMSASSWRRMMIGAMHSIINYKW